jgi:cobalamin biosynthesis protein CobD/CbiB
MSVAAGALGVRLSKRRVYDLGAAFPLPERRDVACGLRWTALAAWLAVTIAIVASMIVSS